MKAFHVANKAPQAPSPARTILYSFAGIIGAGTFVLMLPACSRTGAYTPFWDALFTATSATCVTGLIVYDTYSYFSTFGQMVIATLIQIGGLGLLTFTAFFNLLIGRKLGLRGMQLASESINADTLDELPNLVRLVVTFAITVELLGMVLLSFSFVPRYGIDGIGISAFLSISAFCNAGFDILGREAPFISLSNYNGDVLVIYTIMGLISFGGLGVIVWRDLLAYHRTRRLQLHTKVIVGITLVMIFGGGLLFFILEYNGVLVDMPMTEKISASLFQSVTSRTAGFNSVDIEALGELTKTLMIVLMFIGAAPGSTAGGIKITTVAVLVMTVVGVVRGREDTVILHRKVSKQVIYRALTVLVLALIAVGVCSLVLFGATPGLGTSQNPSINGIFEAVSAFGTVGLSAGVTATTDLTGRFFLIALMFLGRVGPVTLLFSMALRDNQSRRQIIPEGKIYL